MIRRRSGFTLVELLVVVSLLTIVVGLLTYPLIAGFTFLSKGKARHEANAATRFAMTVMTRELSNAIDVILVQADPAEGDKIVFVLPAMRTWCPEGGDWLRDADGRYYYSYYCPEHLTANVEHELTDPIVPMRNRYGERVAVVYCKSASIDNWDATAPGEYLARAVVPFPGPNLLQDWGAWSVQLAQTTPGALTPTGEKFHLESLRFSPTAVKNEVLTAYRRGGESDYSLYRARYPLWGPEGWRVDVRDDVGMVVETILPGTPQANQQVDVRSGTVSFAQEQTEPPSQAGYLPGKPLMPPAVGPFGPIARGTEVVLGPPYNSPLLRTATVSGDLPPVLDPPKRGEYWIDYDAGLIYVNPSYTLGNPPPTFTVRFMRHQIGSGYSVIASYKTYALLNIDLNVCKVEAESGKAGPEGVLGEHQEFHVSGKVKLLNVAR